MISGDVLIVIIISLAFLGCGATKAVKMNQVAMKEAYQIQKPIIVQTSLDDDRPEWTQRTVFEKNGKVYFTGGFKKTHDSRYTRHSSLVLIKSFTHSSQGP